MTTVYLHTQARDRLTSLTDRTRILDLLSSLEKNPVEIHGDYIHPDPKGRAIEVKILGRHAVLFFKDPFADIVKILDILHLESP